MPTGASSHCSTQAPSRNQLSTRKSLECVAYSTHYVFREAGWPSASATGAINQLSKENDEATSSMNVQVLQNVISFLKIGG